MRRVRLGLDAGTLPGMTAEEALAGAEAMEPPARRLSIGARGQGPSGARQYTLSVPVARGGMGEIYLAEQTDARGNRRHVIVKRLLENLKNDEDYVEMFRTEEEHLKRLHHPNIVQIYDAPMINGARCLALEYVRGRSVAQLLDRCRALKIKIPPEVALYVLAEVLKGLDHVHRAMGDDGKPLELVHRDVTPGNLLVGFDGEVKLTDFGIAKSQMSAVSTTVGIVKGKARYLSPEQILGERATPRSDLFACGCVLFEMLTGTPLYERPSVPKTLAAIVHGELPDFGTTLPVRTDKITAVLHKSLAVRQEKRHDRAMEMALDLLAAARELTDVDLKVAASDFMRMVFEGQAESWEAMAAEPLPPVAPVPARPSDAPTAIADSEHSTALGAAVEPPKTPEPRLRAASIAEQDAVRDAVMDSPMASLIGGFEPTPAIEPAPFGPLLRSAVHEQTAVVERVRKRAEPLPKFPAPAVSLIEPEAREMSPHPTMRIPERRPQSPIPEGEEATLAVAPESPLEPERKRAADSSEIRTEAAIYLKPAPEAPVIIDVTEPRAAQAERAATKIDRPGAAGGGGGGISPHTSTRITVPRPARVVEDVPASRGGFQRAHGIGFAAVFVMGALVGVGMNELLREDADDRVTRVPAAEAVVPEIGAPAYEALEAEAEPPPPALDDATLERRIEAEAAAAAQAERGDSTAQKSAPAAQAPAMATLDILAPRGGRVRIDGELLKRKLPIRGLELAPGPHEIWVSYKRQRRRYEITLEPGQRAELEQMDSSPRR